MPRNVRVLEAGDPRRMSDGKNAWRKMDDTQRVGFLHWIWLEDKEGRIDIPGDWWVSSPGLD